MPKPFVIRVFGSQNLRLQQKGKHVKSFIGGDLVKGYKEKKGAHQERNAAVLRRSQPFIMDIRTMTHGCCPRLSPKP